jgi:alkaline phosphatase D
VYEFTSSGLTFANDDHIPFVETIFKFIFPSTFSSFDDHYYKSNFGILKIETDKDHSPIKIVFETHSSKDSSVVLKKEINISEL